MNELEQIIELIRDDMDIMIDYLLCYEVYMGQAQGEERRQMEDIFEQIGDRFLANHTAIWGSIPLALQPIELDNTD